MILKPLQKIEVIESTKKWKPGSVGYFVCQEPFGNYNGWNVLVIFTRFGKKGKHRLEMTNIGVHMIEYDQLKKSDRTIMEIVKFAEGIEPRMHPSDVGKSKPRYSQTLGGSIIVPIQVDHKDLLETETWDFMAYTTAISLYIYKLSFGRDLYRLLLVPPIKMSEFVGSGSDLSNVQAPNMGYYILRGLSMDTNKKTKVFEEIYLDFFENMSNRRKCLEKLLISLSACRQQDSQYKEDIKARYKHVEQVFDNTLKHYRRKRKSLQRVKEAEKANAANPSIVPHFGSIATKEVYNYKTQSGEVITGKTLNMASTYGHTSTYTLINTYTQEPEAISVGPTDDVPEEASNDEPDPREAVNVPER